MVIMRPIENIKVRFNLDELLIRGACMQLLNGG